MMAVRNLKLTVDSHIQNAGEQEKLARLHSLIVRAVSAMNIGEQVKITLEYAAPVGGFKEEPLSSNAYGPVSRNQVSVRPYMHGSKLSERQHQIAVMLCNHYSIKKIANECCVSENTVKKHMQNIKKTLEIECSGADFIYTLKQMLFPETVIRNG
ncbi:MULTISPECIES: response regulator transcription factor [Paenibacillus]|uniref:Response regulator transcription factor n=1 Tax=Paenibacillus vulneris TaxID=1133364 RepID=A0ABW3UTM1_9BACL|nr:helix-turn-helix transcriptional regulator [Paenibacillus sp. 32352]